MDDLLHNIDRELDVDPNDSSTSDFVAAPSIQVDDDDLGLSEIVVTPPANQISQSPNQMEKQSDIFSEITDDNITPMETDPDPATNARVSRQSKTFDG